MRKNEKTRTKKRETEREREKINELPGTLPIHLSTFSSLTFDGPLKSSYGKSSPWKIEHSGI